MSTFTYIYPMGATLWCLIDNVAVNSCIAKQVDIVDTVDGTSVRYTVVSHNKTFKKNEEDLYGTLNAALLALSELLD